MLSIPQLPHNNQDENKAEALEARNHRNNSSKAKRTGRDKAEAKEGKSAASEPAQGWDWTEKAVFDFTRGIYVS